MPSVGPPARWLPSGGSLLVLSKAPSKPPAGVGVVRPRGPGEGVDGDYVVYDVPSGRVVNALHGHFATWASPHGVAAFVSGGRINVFSRP